MTTKKPNKSVSPVLRSPEWQNPVTGDTWVAGAPVSVSASRLEGKKGLRWVFWYHCLDTNTGKEWIEVYGGRTNNYRIWAFNLNEVVLIKPKRKYTRRKNAAGS